MKCEKNGLLIVNGFMRSEKFDELYGFLSAAAKERGISLAVRTNIDMMCDASTGLPLTSAAKSDIERAAFALFWDKDVRLAYQLEALGLRLMNGARAIEVCDDKSLTHIALAGKVAMPKTVVAPLTFPRVGYTDKAFLKGVADALGFPLVVKECFGSFGMQVYLANDEAELLGILEKTSGKPILFQKFVSESFARDVRIYVVGEVAEAAMLRENASGDFRANVALGGSTTAYTPSPEQAAMAVNAAKLLGLDFAGVDLLFGEGGAPCLCEVNSNAHFLGMYACTGINIAERIMRHIDKEIFGE